MSEAPILTDKIVYNPKPHRKLEANRMQIDKAATSCIMNWYNSIENQDPEGVIAVAFSTDTTYDANKGVIYLNKPGTYNITASWSKDGAAGHAGIWLHYADDKSPVTITNKTTFTGFGYLSVNANSVSPDGSIQTSRTIHVPPQHVPARIMVAASSTSSVSGDVFVKGHVGSPSVGGSISSFCQITYLGA